MDSRSGVGILCRLFLIANGFCFSASPLIASDLLAPALPDARAKGHLSDGELLKQGTLYGSMGFDAGVSLDATVFDAEDGKLDRVNRMRLGLGYGLTKYLELGLSVQGTYETVGQTTREGLYAYGETAEAYEIESQNLKRTAFSGASLMFKFSLLNLENLKVSFSPFIESGSGEQASYTVSRSVDSKAGWVLASTVGVRKAWELNLNAGYRYRTPEAVGQYLMHNELFYRAGGRVYVSKRVSLMAAAGARNIKVLDRELPKAGRDYRDSVSADAQAGATYEVEGYQLTLYGGGGMGGNRGVGYHGESYGVQLAMPLGSTKHRHAKKTFADKIDQNKQPAQPRELSEDEKWDLSQKQEEDKARAQMANDLDFDVDNFDLMSGLKGNPGEEDDFNRVEGDLKNLEEKYPGPTEDEKVAAELAKLREAEKIEEARRAEEEVREAAARRRLEAIQLKEDAKKSKKWLKEANEELDQTEGISQDQLDFETIDNDPAAADPLLKESFGNPYVD